MQKCITILYVIQVSIKNQAGVAIDNKCIKYTDIVTATMVALSRRIYRKDTEEEMTWSKHTLDLAYATLLNLR